MSIFKVELKEISEVLVHPNADRLSLCKVEGLDYQFVTGKDQYKVGDRVVYFPLDALIPPNLVEAMGMVGRFSGSNKNRVSTVKLRGSISQGYVADPEIIRQYLVEKLQVTITTLSTEDLTQSLEVTKYDPPEIICKGGTLSGSHVEGVTHYDIESTDRFMYVLEELMDKEVFVSSKVEGSNWYGGHTGMGNSVVGQRNSQIIPTEGGEEHTWWKTFKLTGLYNKTELVRNALFPGKTVIFRGEIIGPKIQGNYYNLSSFDILVFDILVNGEYLNADQLLEICQKYSIKTVPVLSSGKTLRSWLNGRDINSAATYTSLLIDKLEEGIVIKPMKEEVNKELKGRLMLKKRSAEYLLQSGN